LPHKSLSNSFLGCPTLTALRNKNDQRRANRNGFRQGDLQGYRAPTLIRIQLVISDPWDPVTLVSEGAGLLNRHSVSAWLSGKLQGTM